MAASGAAKITRIYLAYPFISVSWALSGDGRDGLLGGGRNRYGIALTVGELKGFGRNKESQT